MRPNSTVVKPPTYDLLLKLMSDPYLKDFSLVGETALAIYFNHRLSIDLDLFSLKEFDSEKLRQHVSDTYGFERTDQFSNGLMGFITGIKVDFIRHAYQLVNPLEVLNGVRMTSALDISAMKLNAITGNGTRIKDYYDMSVLLEHYPLGKMLEAYELKYPEAGIPIAVRSLTYFDDIDFDREPALMAKPIAFEMVRQRLQAAILDPYKTF